MVSRPIGLSRHLAQAMRSLTSLRNAMFFPPEFAPTTLRSASSHLAPAVLTTSRQSMQGLDLLWAFAAPCELPPR